MHPHVKLYFVIIKDVFIFHCPVAALKQMFLLSSAQQGLDSMFTIGTKPMTYGKFIKYLKWLLKQVWGQTIAVTVLGGGASFAFPVR